MIEESTKFLDDVYGDRVKSRHRKWCLANGILSAEDLPVCVVCKNAPAMLLKEKGIFSETCSMTCSRKKAAMKSSETQKNMSESQKADIQRKREDTYFRKTGYKSHNQNPEIKNKKKMTCIAKYGAENPMQVESIRKKQQNTVEALYGVENISKLSEVKDKKLATCSEHFGGHNAQVHISDSSLDILNTRDRLSEMYKNASGGAYEIASALGVTPRTVLNYMKRHSIAARTPAEASLFHVSPENLLRLEDRDWLEASYRILGGVSLAKELGVESTMVYKRLHKHGIDVNPTNTSAAERQINDFVKSLGFDTIQSDRTILGGRELDIVIPEKKIAIEYNGLFWHSKRFKPDNFHLMKTREAEAAGYRLVHIFEDEWIQREEQVKAKLKSILGVDDRRVVYARKCSVSAIRDKKTIYDFYNTHHIQGKCGQSLTLGLFAEGSVVAMMSFTKRTEAEYELVRFATSERVVGGFSKLLKAAKNELPDTVTSLVSFADKRYSDGGVYEAGGWTFETHLKPDYQYVVGDIRIRKQNFRRKFLSKKLEVFDPALTELENMMANDIYPIYDCGLLKYRLTL